jgi:hypothetical protein
MVFVGALAPALFACSGSQGGGSPAHILSPLTTDQRAQVRDLVRSQALALDAVFDLPAMNEGQASTASDPTMVKMETAMSPCVLSGNPSISTSDPVDSSSTFSLSGTGCPVSVAGQSQYKSTTYTVTSQLSYQVLDPGFRAITDVDSITQNETWTMSQALGGQDGLTRHLSLHSQKLGAVTIDQTMTGVTTTEVTVEEKFQIQMPGYSAEFDYSEHQGPSDTSPVTSYLINGQTATADEFVEILGPQFDSEPR